MKVVLAYAPLLVVACAAGCAQVRDVATPDRAFVRLLGRWDAREAPDRLIAVNPGSSFEFRYEGTGFVLHFDRSANNPPLPQLWVELDGAWSKHVVDRDAIAIGQDAPPGPHKAWVVVKALDEHQARWKPPLVSSVTLTGIEAPGGGFLRPPKPRKLILEAIGDSITEGVLAIRKGDLAEWTEIADARATWAFQTALALGAEPRIVGYGAQGVIKGGNGGIPPVGLAYPFVCEGVPADDVPADIVVINQGCNDASAPTIEHGYLKLIALVRKRNPEAHIFCVVPFAQYQGRSIRYAVAAARAEGDARVHLVETQDWIDAKTDTTDGIHPNEAGHKKAAEKLTALIRDTIGK